MIFYKILIFVVSLEIVCGSLFIDKHESIIVVPKLGRIAGTSREYKDFSPSRYYQYKGIPFAEPVERFALAQPKQEWVGTHDGKVEGKVCPQPMGNFFYPGEIDERNCLVLTVTTPFDPNTNNETLPVLVFFFGGAFLIGTVHTNWYNPERLVHENIIVVQINYRLGAMGWISDGTIIPKNIGLKDCVLGLEWVQRNIHAFGGDPTQVTIYGQSAGAIICDALWQSERTQHLFRAVFLQSGTLINPHSVQKNTENAFRQTISTSPCKNTLEKSISLQVECLKGLPEQVLAYSSGVSYVQVDTLQFGSVNGLIASVLVEDSSDPNAIVTMNPLERLKIGAFSKDKPIIISITSEERITFEFLRTSLRGKQNKALVPSGMNANDPEKVGSLIKNYYGNSEAEFEKLPNSALIRVSSDILYNNGLRKFIELVQPHLEENTGIYCMQFSYASKIGMLNFNGQVGHVDDLFYIWGLQAISTERIRRPFIPAKAFEKRNQILKLIGNFVKTGNPTPIIDPILENITWPRINRVDHVEYLNFDTFLNVSYNPKNENYKFWMDLYETYRNVSMPLVSL